MVRGRRNFAPGQHANITFIIGIKREKLKTPKDIPEPFYSIIDLNHGYSRRNRMTADQVLEKLGGVTTGVLAKLQVVINKYKDYDAYNDGCDVGLTGAGNVSDDSEQEFLD